MSECIAMVIGFVLGAGCAIIAGRNITESVHTNTDNATHREETSAAGVSEDERLKKQFENFLNYDGTDKGQVSIGDE